MYMEGLSNLINAVNKEIRMLEGDSEPIESSSNIEASRPFSKFASKFYSKNRIEKNAREGSRKGESMADIFRKIMNDPDIEISEPDKNGDQTLYYNGKDIGWYNPSRCIGYIEDEVYDNLPPYTEPNYEEDYDDIVLGSRSITSAQEITSETDLRNAIEDILDADICEQVVSIAVSEDGTFAKDEFIDSDEFFDAYLANEEPKDVALKFFNGEDLDSRGPANPNRAYLRFDGYENIESTDRPGDIYMDILDTDIVEYIMDHLDDREFPKYVQELIDEYFDNNEED